MAYDEKLAVRLRKVFEGNLDICERKMFGGLAFLCRGHMFVGIMGDELMARVGPDNYPAALLQPHAREMDFTGKPMEGYIFIASATIPTAKTLEKWTGLCLKFADALPPKMTFK